MKKLFGLLFSFCFVVFPCIAEEAEFTQADLDVTTVNSPEKEPEEVVIHPIEKDIKPLPDCNDEVLLQKTLEFVSTYLNQSANMGMMFRRQRYFILNNLNNFKKENVAFYKTEEKRPVSDVIADVAVNEGVIEENMLLCKNQNKNKEVKDLYLLVTPKTENGYKVRVINLDPKIEKVKSIYFEYE